MDTFTVLSNGQVEHHIVPYIPFRLGLAVPLGERVMLGLRLVHSPYIGKGAASGNTRLALGVGLRF